MDRNTLLRILDLGRWTPSGDNTQPWRFEILADAHLRIHGFDTREHVLYDFDGHASHIAHGALLETLRIAASSFGQAMRWAIESDPEARAPRYDVFFTAEASLAPDPLAAFIESRVVQRRPMRTTPLDERQRAALVAAAGEDHRVQLFESAGERLSVAKLLWANAYLRLTCPEAYKVHKEIIEWRARYSKDRIPEQAVGVDPLTGRLMEWVMQRWERVRFFNRFLGGTIAPRLQLDFMPALRCAAHLLVRPQRPPEVLDDWLRLGMAMQRIWLTATQHGLHLQPQMTPVIFRWYARSGRRFSADEPLFAAAVDLSEDFERIAGATPQDAFGFFARVGRSTAPHSRSVRQDLEFLTEHGRARRNG